MKPNPITGSRIKQLRTERGETQEEFGKHFGEFCGKSAPISVMTISNWETARKQPPFDTLLWLQRYYGVSLDYIAGLSDTKYIGKEPTGITTETDSLRKGIEIPLVDLKSHDGEPVYVVFPSTYQNQWGIIDYPNNLIVFRTFNLTINPKCQYFSYVVPEEITIRSLATHLLNYKDMMDKDVVWIESLSPDPFIKGRITGWYHHSPDKEFLINDMGLTLSYEGLGITYNAKEFKSTRKAKAPDKSPSVAASASPEKKASSSRKKK